VVFTVSPGVPTGPIVLLMMRGPAAIVIRRTYVWNVLP